MKTEDAKKKSGLRIFIADDHPVVRNAMRHLIAQRKEYLVCGEAEGLFNAAREITDSKADVFITDLSFPDGNALDLIKEIKKARPQMLILVFSMHDEKIYAFRALRSGASGYIMKSQPLTKILEGLDNIIKGRLYINDDIRDEVLMQLIEAGKTEDSRPERCLSDRELQVFTSIGRGESTRQISLDMHLSIKTIQAYRERIKGKLKLANAAELAKIAISWVENNSKSGA